MKDTFLIRETLGGVIAYERPDYMVRDDRETKHSYDLDIDDFTVHIELSVSDEPYWKTAGMIMQSRDTFIEKVEDSFPNCLASDPEKIVSARGVEEVLIEYAFQDEYEGQDYNATGAIVYIPLGEKMAQVSFMYLDFSDNGANFDHAYHDFLDIISSVEIIATKTAG